MKNISERCEDCERLGYVCNGDYDNEQVCELGMDVTNAKNCRYFKDKNDTHIDNINNVYEWGT